MKGFKGYLKTLLFILVCFVFQNISAQFSKTHYIPPIATIISNVVNFLFITMII